MIRPILAFTLAAGLLTALPAAAQFQKPEDAIRYRQGAFTLLGAHFGRLAGMAQGKIPFDAKAAADNAAVVKAVAHLPFAAFPAGSDAGARNRAEPAIWSDAAKFKAGADDMVKAIGDLDTAARSGNLDQIKAAVGATGKTCKACHDSFRSEKWHE